MPSKTGKKLGKGTTDLLVLHLLLQWDWGVFTLFSLLHMGHYNCQPEYSHHLDESMSYIYK